MPILFCNIAWMKKYAGRSAKDPPLGGGAFPRSEGYCSEECNFVPCEDGYVYGHFETIKGDDDRKVLIERLGASKSDNFLDGVDIVWTAPTKGHDPRAVVGWWRNARLYRERQQFNGHFPSAQHRKDEIISFRVRASRGEAVLLPSGQRTMTLQRGAGWSGQASWWYADDTRNPAARRFVSAVRSLMDGYHAPPAQPGASRRIGPAGAAASRAYRRYLRTYEVKVHPRHHKLQKRFKAFLRNCHSEIAFPQCFRDDLRYVVGSEREVMVEVKPADPTTVRLAIRTAIGQLLDYKQHQRWNGEQLILVDVAVTNADDLSLAFDNGFGLAWPDEKEGFKIRWPR